MTRVASPYVWHPYTQHGWGRVPLKVVSANGAYLTLDDGRRILDAISSWWVTIHGHGHPRIAQAIAAQAQALDHVIFSGFTHDPAEQLSEALIKYVLSADTGLRRVFYSDNGSTAVETALKMAYLFHHRNGHPKPSQFLALKHGYHGETLGAAMLGGLDEFHEGFKDLTPSPVLVEPGDFDDLEKKILENADRCCAFVLEPLLQGAGGMRMYSMEFLREIRRWCTRFGILLIVDEVFTGFGRTGKTFAFEHAGISPDVLCLSKGLTGGTLPLGATLCTEEIFSAFLSEDFRRAFLHGHSFSGNPIGCAAALASWEVLQTDDCQKRIQAIEAATKEHIESLASHPRVSSARALGTVGAITLDSDGGYFSSTARNVSALALEEGVLLRPLGDVLYAVPPYCLDAEEMGRIYEAMGRAVDRLERA